MNYSYERVSTIRQDVRRQELSLENYKIDKKYIDKATGKNANRPELNNLMLDINKAITSILRLGRNVDNLNS